MTLVDIGGCAFGDKRVLTLVHLTVHARLCEYVKDAQVGEKAGRVERDEVEFEIHVISGSAWHDVPQEEHPALRLRNVHSSAVESDRQAAKCHSLEHVVSRTWARKREGKWTRRQRREPPRRRRARRGKRREALKISVFPSQARSRRRYVFFTTRFCVASHSPQLAWTFALMALRDWMMSWR